MSNSNHRGPMVGSPAREPMEPKDTTSQTSVAIPDPEVPARASRRRFKAEYKLRILEELDGVVEPGEQGRILRREGLYSSHITQWRQARRKGALLSLSQKRGPRPSPDTELKMENERLEREVARLRESLRRAELIIEVQGKVAGLLGIPLDTERTS